MVKKQISASVLTLLIAPFLAVAFLSSCKKEDNKDRDTMAASDYMKAENRFTEVKLICDEAALPAAHTGGILSATGVSVSYDTANFADPDTITIDFGLAGIACSDDRIRKGKIIMNITGHYGDSLSRTTVLFSNYRTEGDAIAGADTLINMGTDTASGLPAFHSLVRGAVYLQSGGSINWNVDKTIKQTAGSSTPTVSDDEYSVTGMGNGAQHTGRTFAAQIVSPLVRTRSCKYFTAGQVQLLPTAKSLRVIDAGSGACDDLATVALEGEQYMIHME